MLNEIFSSDVNDVSFRSVIETVQLNPTFFTHFRNPPLACQAVLRIRTPTNIGSNPSIGVSNDSYKVGPYYFFNGFITPINGLING